MFNIRFLKVVLVLVLGIAVVALSTQAVARTLIKDTRHNLSNWSPYKTSVQGDTTQVCIFCHAPHNADSTQVPLWNRTDTAVSTFKMASSTNVTPGVGSATNQPEGISKKCLSCHDGSIALGDLSNGGPITVTGSRVDGDGSLKDDSANAFGSFYGYDLSKGHVISFVYKDVPTGSAGLKDWNSIPQADRNAMFDRQGRMQCHSCHDPHNDWCNDGSKTVGNDPLWRKECNGTGKNSSVCEVCHNTTFSGYTREYPY